MLEIAALMMIASSAIHAVVNAVLKSGEDKLASRALIDLSGGLLVLPAIFFFPPPHGAWSWLLGSLVAHAVYFLALVRAFEVADMSATYPVMRGTAPVFAAFGAVVFLGDPIALPVAIGMGLVTSGLLLSAIGRNLTREALGYSLLTGLAVATYTVLDAGGVRERSDALFLHRMGFLRAGSCDRRGVWSLAWPRLHRLHTPQLEELRRSRSGGRGQLWPCNACLFGR